MRQPSGGKTMREPSGGGTMSKPSGGKTMRKPSDGGTMRKSSGLPDNIGTAKHMRRSFEAKKKEERRDNSETVKAYSIQKKRLNENKASTSSSNTRGADNRAATIPECYTSAPLAR